MRDKLVGMTGLEPARISPRDPKSRASAIPPHAHYCAGLESYKPMIIEETKILTS